MTISQFARRRLDRLSIPDSGLSDETTKIASDFRTQVLLLGATSLIGRFLTPRLADAGFKTVAISRAPPLSHQREAAEKASGLLSWTQGDLTAPDELPQLEVADVIVSLSPIWLLPPALPSLFKTGARRLIAFPSTSRLTKIQSPVAAEREVARRLAEGEVETVRLCATAGVACTLLRPTLIYAEGQDRNVSRLAEMIRRFGVLPLSGGGGGLRQPVHADDLAAAALSILDAPTTFGKIYALPGGETLTYRAMAERVFEGLGRRPRIVVVPPRLWRLGLALASPLLKGATSAMGERMAKDLTFDPAPAQAEFGWSPRLFRPQFVQSSDEIKTATAL
jgi:nucleoside-diphosphate-sugar epimerase